MILRKIITKFIPQHFFNPLQRIFDFFPFYQIYRFLVFLEIKSVKLRPRVIFIKTTNTCNASCVMCPRELMKRGLGIMEIGLYRKIIDQAKGLNIKEVHLQNFGEPLLDPHIAERISYANKQDLKTVIFSNGSLLRSKLSEEFILSGLDELYISFDAAREDTYSKARPGLKFSDVEKNISDFILIRDVLNSKKPIVTLVFTQSFQDKNEVKEFIRKWKAVVDIVYIKKSHDWGGVKPRYSRKYTPRHFWPCEYLWRSLTILCNGQVTACCVDFNGDINFGNVNNDSIEHIWNGKVLEFYRKSHMENKRKLLDVCLTCSLNKPWII